MHINIKSNIIILIRWHYTWTNVKWKKIWCKIVHSGISTVWKVCAQEKVWKEIFQMLTVIFLGNENRIIGESYWLYMFCTCQVFHRDHLYFERGKKPMHEKQFNKGPKLLFWTGAICLHFPLPILQLVVSRPPEAGNITTYRWLTPCQYGSLF